MSDAALGERISRMATCSPSIFHSLLVKKFEPESLGVESESRVLINSNLQGLVEDN